MENHACVLKFKVPGFCAFKLRFFCSHLTFKIIMNVCFPHNSDSKHFKKYYVKVIYSFLQIHGSLLNCFELHPDFPFISIWADSVLPLNTGPWGCSPYQTVVEQRFSKCGPPAKANTWEIITNTNYWILWNQKLLVGEWPNNLDLTSLPWDSDAHLWEFGDKGSD